MVLQPKSNLGGYPLILGRPWLATVDSYISWLDQTASPHILSYIMDQNSQKNCFMAALSLQSDYMPYPLGFIAESSSRPV